MIIPPAGYQRDTFCSYCGNKFVEQRLWPRTCFICHHDSYRNPIPVAVGLVRILKRGDLFHPGWLIEQRGIEPKKNEWALPGGFIEFGESWQEALARELMEEVGLITQPHHFKLWDVVHTPITGNMLIFGLHTSEVYEDEVDFKINREVLAIKFPCTPSEQELCFPSHNEVWEKCHQLGW